MQITGATLNGLGTSLLLILVLFTLSLSIMQLRW